MAAPGIKAVAFDLGGVLFDYRPATRWQRYANLTGLTPNEVQKRLSGSGYALACDQGRHRGAAAYREGIRALGTRLSMERFADIWVSAFTPNVDVLELATAVKRRIPTAVLTNNSDLVRDGLESRWPDQLSPFMPRIFSTDLGLTKPDPRVFNQAALLLGESPEQLLLVDDSRANTDCAAALGFHTHHFTTVGALREALQALELL